MFDNIARSVQLLTYNYDYLAIKKCCFGKLLINSYSYELYLYHFMLPNITS